MVFTVQDEDVKNQLVRKHFEVVGQIGDNVNRKKVYTIHGDENKISKLELPYITKIRFTRKGGD